MTDAGPLELDTERSLERAELPFKVIELLLAVPSVDALPTPVVVRNAVPALADAGTAKATVNVLVAPGANAPETSHLTLPLPVSAQMAVDAAST
jgi:hypothetical protein